MPWKFWRTPSLIDKPAAFSAALGRCYCQAVSSRVAFVSSRRPYGRRRRPPCRRQEPISLNACSYRATSPSPAAGRQAFAPFQPGLSTAHWIALWISRPFVGADRRRASPCSSACIPARLDRCNRLFHVDHICLSQTNDEYDDNRDGCP
jgi:hypothetical protein